MNQNTQPKLDILYKNQLTMLTNKVARIVGCQFTAEDIAQEAYLRVSATLANRQVEYLRAYLYQTAHNLALDHLRKQAVREGGKRDHCSEPVSALDDLPSGMMGPEEIVISMQKVNDLKAIISSLPERRRKILLLHKVHHWKYKDIALHFGISVSAVEKHIKLALDHCMKN